MRALPGALRSVMVLLLLWQGLVWLFAPPQYILPGPLRVLAVFADRPGLLLHHSLITLQEIVLGFLLGAGLGALAALAMTALPMLGRLVWPMVLVLQAFPVFVIAPLLVLWFGFGMGSKIVMTALIIFFPVTSAFADGLRRTDPELLEVLALTPASRWDGFWRVRVPLGLPGLVTGLRMAAPLAPLGAVIGEWVGASAGLGFLMVQANARMQTDVVFAAMTILAGLALLLRRLVDHFAPRLTPWVRETTT